MEIYTLTERAECLPYNGDTQSQNAPSVCLIMEIHTVTEHAECLPYNEDIYTHTHAECLPYNEDIYTHRTRRLSAL